MTFHGNSSSKNHPVREGFMRSIKGITKMSLKKVVGKTRLSYDESVTVISEIRNLVNSRLLTYLTEENYQTPLSPAICKPRH